ncbi:MAG: cytochrome c peroxidase [Jannaschia sp.]
MTDRPNRIAAIAVAATLVATGAMAQEETGRLPPPPDVDAARADLGRMLFFDDRLSGDVSRSCSTCHAPETGWTTRLPMSEGYTDTPHFRNAPSLLNVAHRNTLHWDARLDGADLGTASRDGIVEAHFMNADSRLVQERLKQVPEYLAMFQEAYDGEPYGGRIYGALGEYMKTIRTEDAPFTAFLDGDDAAISDAAAAGWDLFQGEAGCVACHSGPTFSDGGVHATGVPDHPDLATDAARQITMLRYYSSFGVPNYMNLRRDVGFYAVSKDAEDIGRFATPPLWDVGRTAPYMHSGVFGTLEEVVDHYDAGADGTLVPLDLTSDESAALVAFLESLTGAAPAVEVPDLPDYADTAPEVSR